MDYAHSTFSREVVQAVQDGEAEIINNTVRMMADSKCAIPTPMGFTLDSVKAVAAGRARIENGSIQYLTMFENCTDAAYVQAQFSLETLQAIQDGTAEVVNDTVRFVSNGACAVPVPVGFSYQIVKDIAEGRAVLEDDEVKYVEEPEQ